MLAVGIRLRNGGEEDSGAPALPLKPEQLRIPIRPLQEPIDQQIRRDPAERDPVPPVAKREIAMGKLPHAADVGQAVPALPEGAAPSPIDVARNGGEQLGETVFEPGSLTGEKAMAVVRGRERPVGTTHHDTPVAGGAGVEIRTRRFPDEASV